MNYTLQAANLCAAMYQDKSADYWDHYWEFDGVVMGHKVIDNVHHFVPRGSKTLSDWLRDIAAAPVYRDDIGHIHGGFGLGADEAVSNILAVVTPGEAIEFDGHSLAGAEACIYAGILIAKKIPVSNIFLFGCPRPGYEPLASLVQQAKHKESWWNVGDLVPRMPEPLPFVLPYMWSVTPGRFNEPYAPTDQDDLFRSHHIGLYEDGAKKL